MNIFRSKINDQYLKYILILGWISCWSSLSLNPENLQFNTITSNFNLKEFLNFLRGVSQIIYFPIIILITLFFSIKENFLINKSNIILILSIFFHLMQSIGLLLSENQILNLYYTISALNVIFTSLLFKNFFSEKEVKILLNINILFLSLIFIIFTLNYLKSSIIYGTNLYEVWGLLDKFSTYQVPRPTGLSRTALILLIFYNTIKYKSRSNFWMSAFTSITTSLIILFSSRTINFIFLFYIIFYIYFFKVYNWKNIKIFLRNFILLPLIYIFIINTSINISLNYKNVQNISKLNILENNILRDFPNPKERPKHTYSSGRFTDWKNIIKKNKQIIIGNGVMGDRLLIDQSASNILLYSYASSGLIGTVLISILSLLTLFSILNLMIFKKIKLKNSYILTSCLILICLMLRSILETSYGVFGIDLILFCSCIAIITKNEEVKKNESI